MFILLFVPLVQLAENASRDPLPVSSPLPSRCGAHPLPPAPNLTELAFHWLLNTGMTANHLHSEKPLPVQATLSRLCFIMEEDRQCS